METFQQELLNKIKDEAVRLGALVAEIESARTLDQRWIAIAKTDLQKGLMALRRGVAYPSTF